MTFKTCLKELAPKVIYEIPDRYMIHLKEKNPSTWIFALSPYSQSLITVQQWINNESTMTTGRSKRAEAFIRASPAKLVVCETWRAGPVEFRA